MWEAKTGHSTCEDNALAVHLNAYWLNCLFTCNVIFFTVTFLPSWKRGKKLSFHVFMSISELKIWSCAIPSGQLSILTMQSANAFLQFCFSWSASLTARLGTSGFNLITRKNLSRNTAKLPLKKYLLKGSPRLCIMPSLQRSSPIGTEKKASSKCCICFFNQISSSSV